MNTNETKDTIIEVKASTCHECGAVITDQGCDYVGGKLICSECMDYYLESAPRVVECEPGWGANHAEPFYWISGYGWHPYDIPENFPYEDVSYVHTDVWRGYFDPKVRDGFTLLEGWTTGWVDDTVTRKNLVNDFLEMIQNEALCPCNIWIFIARTSNVFSTGIGIAFKTADANILGEWLNDNLSCNLVQLQSALG